MIYVSTKNRDENNPCSWYWQKSSLFLVLAKTIPVLGTGKNHLCSWYWLKSSLFLVLTKIIPVLGAEKNHPCSWYWQISFLFLVRVNSSLFLVSVPRTGMIVTRTKNRDDICQYQEEG
jgi:hypothetical protein